MNMKVQAGMKRNRYRMLLVCLVLLIGGWITIAARSAAPPAQPPAAQPQGSFLTDPNFVSSPGVNLGNGSLMTRMLLSILVVIALGGGLMYVMKRVMPKVANTAGKEIHVRETTHLGPHKTLHLVEIGNHKLLIGSTNDHITTLADLTDAWLDVPKQETDEAVRL
jgi:flagellar biosynthetic protein FliO